MTEAQRSKCHTIIHTAAITAGGGNAVPVPGLGLAADTVALVGMAVSLASVFGRSLPSSVAKTMAVDALKKTILRQPIKVLMKEFSKFIPGLGWAFAATVSAGLVEAAGWSLANDLEMEQCRLPA